MKSVFLRAGLALLCAVVLNGCGGGNDGNLLLSGTISGLSKAGLVLVNKPTGEKLTIASGAGSFQFTRLLAVDEEFDVEVDTQPTGAICTPSANKNKANVYTAYYVVITCKTNPWTLGGVVKGLESDGNDATNDGVTLANGPDTASAQPPATPGADVQFSFANFVGDGSPYGVTVLVQPSNKTCTLSPDAIGTMPAGDYRKLVVTCVNK